MAATYTPGSGLVLDQTRVLIPDKDIAGLTPVDGVYTLTTYTYTDEEIADFLTLESDDPYRAAALAIETSVSILASGGKVSGLGFSVDDSLGVNALLKRAAWLRSQASTGGGALTFVPLTYGADSVDEFARPEGWW